MFFHINASNGVPVFEQVARQIIFAVAGNVIRPGEMIPSVRQLAKQLAVNPNTVARAYRDLQEQGVVSTRRGQGLVIESDAQRICKSKRSELIETQLENVLNEARQSQLSDAAIEKMVSRILAKKRKDN